MVQGESTKCLTINIVLSTSCDPRVVLVMTMICSMICHDNLFFPPHQSPPMPPEPSQTLRLRQYRKGSRYTVEERKIIEPYKVAFRTQDSKAGRVQILRSNILPAIFNYWVSVDKAPKDDEESRARAKVDCQACQGCIIDHIARN